MTPRSGIGFTSYESAVAFGKNRCSVKSAASVVQIDPVPVQLSTYRNLTLGSFAPLWRYYPHLQHAFGEKFGLVSGIFKQEFHAELASQVIEQERQTYPENHPQKRIYQRIRQRGEFLKNQ